jgi:hypothetical protein
MYLGWPGYDEQLTTDTALAATLKRTVSGLQV